MDVGRGAVLVAAARTLRYVVQYASGPSAMSIREAEIDATDDRAAARIAREGVSDVNEMVLRVMPVQDDGGAA